jgi:hypothetical protein
MKEKKLSKTKKKSYSAKERLKIVVEIHTGIKTFKQSSSEYALPISKLRKWNWWYFKIRTFVIFGLNLLPRVLEMPK